MSLLFILLEPILNLSKTMTLEPANLVFIDNSRSITIEDGTERVSDVNEIVEDLGKKASESNYTFYTFGNSLAEIDRDSLEQIRFTEGSTNLQSIFDYIKDSEQNIASATIVTDGVITSGSNPYYEATNLGVPVFTIGIGDTTQRKDIEIKKVLHNDYLYAETPSSIIATIFNKGFSGKEVKVSLFEDNKFVSDETIMLSISGIQSVTFNYKPETSGEKKLSVVVTDFKDEFTTANNKKLFYVDVLSNKIKVLLLASSPSADLTFIRNALNRDENLEISSIVQIGSNKFLDELNYNHVDSADVFYLIGFPSDNTPADLFNQVNKRINEENIPYFLTLSQGISLNRLKNLGSELAFTISQSIAGYREVQPYVLPEQVNNPILKQGDKNPLELWNNLPPVLQPKSIFNARVESRVLAQINVGNNVINSPLILSRNFSGKRTVTVLAKDIWKWKLQVANKGIEVFDNFIVNSLRWLRANEEQKLVDIETSKKNYSQGESIEFSAQVFDESINPVSDAEIKIDINSEQKNYELEMQNVGPGLYEGAMVINETGDFRFSGEAKVDGRSMGKDNGSFNIGEIDLEMIDPVMNFSLLNLLANDSGGEFYMPSDYNSLQKRIDELNRISTKEKVVTSEITLWSDTWMLILAIFFFSLEWFIRKRNGML